MRFKIQHIEETDSTNRWLTEWPADGEMAVWTDFQTAGRGCGTNRWESERGQNLLFSVLVRPRQMAAKDQFALSMALALGMHDALAHVINKVCGGHTAEALTIKWPNDIYWGDRKLCGILIENRLSGAQVRESIMGVGLNVNQTVFLSDAPNPVSLKQITAQTLDRATLLEAILAAFEARLTAYETCDDAQMAFDDLRFNYVERLYRRNGFHLYRDAAGDFEAETETIEDSGALILRDRGGQLRRYAFKEVHFVITR